jgi:hypothetical protein
LYSFTKIKHFALQRYLVYADSIGVTVGIFTIRAKGQKVARAAKPRVFASEFQHLRNLIAHNEILSNIGMQKFNAFDARDKNHGRRKSQDTIEDVVKCVSFSFYCVCHKVNMVNGKITDDEVVFLDL